ncbi:MAG: PP2C family protein-serine/threonine phosphatase [Oscillospiraceae bacterium]|nr:PP2C family protein-serine/threonine phosphatase [Oscillospiraceae bacterium]
MKFLKQHVTAKSIAGIVLLLVTFSVIISIIGYRSFTEALLDQYADGAFMTADTAAGIVNADRMDEYAQSGGTTLEYRAVWEKLDALCNSSGVTFVYVIQPDRSDYAHITFLFSTINHESPYSVYPFGYVRETTNEEYREKYRALCEQTAESELVVRDKGVIETDPHITAMIGLKGSDGEVKAILCVQRQMDAMMKARNVYINNVVLVLIILAILVIVGQSLFLHRALLRPLEQISEEAMRFSTENISSGKKLQDTIRNEDEIGQLAASIDRMEEQIQDYVENLTRITAERERISAELSLATRIQADMLPNIFPAFPDRRDFDIYAMMDPAKEVGGDFYDFFLVDEGHLGIVMADVSGKGIPAALFMTISKIVVQDFAMSAQNPVEALERANAQICLNNREDMFVTVWLGILDLNSGVLTASNAGHEYPAIRKAEESFSLLKDKHGFVIGVMEKSRYQNYEIRLEPGDELFLYTDGVPEATSSSDELYGTERMLSALNRFRDEEPEELLKKMREDIAGFAGGAPQFDDITMLCLKYIGGENKP